MTLLNNNLSVIMDDYILDKSDAFSQTENIENTKDVQPRQLKAANTGNDESIYSRQVRTMMVF